LAMISLRSIKKAFTALLKQNYPKYAVHFDNVEKRDAPYFYVEMQPLIRTVDRVYSERTIQVDITFVPEEDRYSRVDRAVLYDIADTLDALVRPVFYVEDRAITILDAETTIHDEVLHYIFNLEFADYREANRLTEDLMAELQFTLKKE
jgi:hypothetical protein